MPLSDLRPHLDALEQVLAEERRALDHLDLGALDACRDKKLRLDERLRSALATIAGAPAPGEKAAIVARLEGLRTEARRNQLRLEAVYAAVKGLRAALGGADTTGLYGPPRATRRSGPPPLFASVVE